MITSSLRFAARSCPSSHSLPPRPSTPLAACFSSNTHQRRHSSSKPPVPPNNGSPSIPATSVKTVGTPRSKDPADKKAVGEPRLQKRKIARDRGEGKPDGKRELPLALPSVPSTQHLDPKGEALHISFAMFRQVLINPLPRYISSIIFFDTPAHVRVFSGTNPCYTRGV